MRYPIARFVPAALAALSLASCTKSAPPASTPAAPASPAAQAPAAPAGPTPEDAKAFVANVNEELKRFNQKSATAEWIKSTYITDDTEKNAANLNEELLGYVAKAIKDSVKFNDLSKQGKLDPDTDRMLYLLRVSSPLPAPADPKKRLELANTMAKLEGMYGKGKYCKQAKGKEQCRDLEQLSDTMAKSRNYDELLDAWQGWHSISPPMRPLYAKLVELGNEGAREIAFKDVGEMWRSGYDMPPDQFEKEMDRIWEQQLQPLYQDLHCYVRARLSKQYGAGKVPPQGPIPAHLLGNMWAQEWTNIYPLVEPFPGQASLDVTGAMVKQKWDPLKMVRTGEAFFTSMGLKSLPPSFFEKSMFTKPPDRDVVCHASAWDMNYDAQDEDVRIKMCLKPQEDDLVTIHHELGHDYYYLYYNFRPVLFQAGANDGFHEAIGDALTLSITPEYLQKLGLLGAVQKNDKNVINLQLKDALAKIAFLPFGKLIDQWRWDVFAGNVTPGSYNQAWWALRTKYQGIAPPVTRSEADFDPGAKYHIPANVPYTRYFLALILQYQFHKALCDAAGFKGPLHECSVYGNKEAGAKLARMLELGASKQWPDALEVLTGTRKLDAGPLLEYFQPLRDWLQEQNKDQKCGW